MHTLAQTYRRPSDKMLPEHLSYMVADGNYTHIHFTDGSRVLFGTTMKRFEEWYPYLIRLSKQILINPAAVTNWKQLDSKTMWVKIGGKKHLAARRRISAVVEKLTEILV